jgi:hypothetical protein
VLISTDVLISTACRSACSAGASRDYRTSNRCSPCPSHPSPLTPSSLPPLTSRFDSFPSLCRWQGTPRWRDPVWTRTNEIPRINQCAPVFCGVWRKYGMVWRKNEGCGENQLPVLHYSAELWPDFRKTLTSHVPPTGRDWRPAARRL